MPFFSIITIGRANINEILTTIRSVDLQMITDYEHIIVASSLDQISKRVLGDVSSINQRILVLDQDMGIYSAMNIGISRSNGTYLIFLNSGDYFATKNSLRIMRQQVMSSSVDIPTCYAFAGYQVYEKDFYLRVPSGFKGHQISAPHQSFLAPNSRCFKSKPIYFKEDNPISADSQWIISNIVKYGCIFSCSPVSVMMLGGISNKPSLKYVLKQLHSRNFKRSIYGLAKLLLSFLVSRRLYYRLLAFSNPSQLYVGEHRDSRLLTSGQSILYHN